MNLTAHLSGEYSLWRSSTVDTVSLDADHEMSTILQELMCVDGHNTGLVRLGYVREDHVDHAYQHSVLVGMSSVLVRVGLGLELKDK